MSPENGQMYVQKKPTMYPPWDSTFDAHINKGRVMQIIVKGKNVDLISETTVELCSLAERCRKNNGKTEIWVTIRAASSVREASTLTRPVPCLLKTSSNCPRHPKAVMREPRVNRPPVPLTHWRLDRDSDYPSRTAGQTYILESLRFFRKIKKVLQAVKSCSLFITVSSEIAQIAPNLGT